MFCVLFHNNNDDTSIDKNDREEEKPQPCLTAPSSSPIPELSLVGGKAKALIETTRKGFQVPEGFVLTVDFFDAWMCDVQQTKAWNEFLAIVPEVSSSSSNEENNTNNNKNDTEVVKRLESICDEIKEKCMSYEFTDRQKEALLSSLKECFGYENCIVAVRSSSPEEDLDGKSFAGGYETMLGVKVRTDMTFQHNEGVEGEGRAIMTINEELTSAIRHCFASAFDARIVQYKAQQNMNPDTPKIALVVQRQIASEVAGVVFSLNVQNNAYDEAVINSNFGLGESVVGGDVTPDYYVVDKITGKIMEEKIADKKVAFWLDEEHGGIVKERYGFRPQNQSSLTRDQILEITDLATRVEQAYKKPMDLEWAIQNDKLYLLQSRPITTYIPIYPELLTKPGEQKMIYMEANKCQQGLPDACSQLGANIFVEINLALGVMRGMSFPLNGRHFINASYISRLFGLKRFLAQTQKTMDVSMARAFNKKMMKEEYTVKELPKPHGEMYRKARMISMAKKTAPAIVFGMYSTTKAQKYYDKKVNSIREKLKNVNNDSNIERMTFTQAFDQKLSEYTEFFTIQGMQMLAIMADTKLRKMFRKIPKAKELIDRLHSDLPGSPTTQMGHAMYKLACFPEIQNFNNHNYTIEELAQKINHREEEDGSSLSAEFLEAYDDFMDRFGARVTLEIDIAAPRHYEPEAQQDFLRQLRQVDVNPESNTREMIEQRKKQAYEELLQEAIQMKQKKKFIKNAKILETMMGQREVVKYLWVTIIETLRKVALKQAKEWVEQDRLNTVEDIFCLQIEQIRMAEEHKHYDIRQAVQVNLSRRKPVEHVKNFPVIFDSRGKIIRAPPPQLDDDLLLEEGCSAAFLGDPISGGLVRGVARVMRNPHDKIVKKGDIIVAPSTNPCWTPVFINAGGCVIENGGPLNHSSIIAREYGLPLVSGIEDCCELIEDGQIIEVDGTNGIVRIISDGAEGEEDENIDENENENENEPIEVNELKIGSDVAVNVEDKDVLEVPSPTAASQETASLTTDDDDNDDDVDIINESYDLKLTVEELPMQKNVVVHKNLADDTPATSITETDSDDDDILSYALSSNPGTPTSVCEKQLVLAE